MLLHDACLEKDPQCLELLFVLGSSDSPGFILDGESFALILCDVVELDPTFRRLIYAGAGEIPTLTVLEICFDTVLEYPSTLVGLVTLPVSFVFVQPIPPEA